MINPMMAGGVAGVGGMVKALMDGQDQNNQDQQKAQQMQQLMNMRGVGQPRVADINAAMPSPTGTAMTNPNAPGMQQFMPQSPIGMQPFPQAGAPPVNLDPMTKALFSPIPGMTGGQ